MRGVGLAYNRTPADNKSVWCACKWWTLFHTKILLYVDCCGHGKIILCCLKIVSPSVSPNVCISNWLFTKVANQTATISDRPIPVTNLAINITTPIFIYGLIFWVRGIGSYLLRRRRPLLSAILFTSVLHTVFTKNIYLHRTFSTDLFSLQSLKW